MPVRTVVTLIIVIALVWIGVDVTFSQVPGEIYTLGSPAGKPSAAMTINGSSVVVWESDAMDGDMLGIFGLRFDNAGGPVGSTFQVNTYTASHQREPCVAVDGTGNFVVAWSSYEQDNEGDEIYFQRYNASGVPQGPETRANAYIEGDQRFSNAAFDGSGRFVIVWHSSRPGDVAHPPGVYGRIFGVDGVPIGDEFFVAEIDFQIFPAVSASNLIGFVVTWEEEHTDGWDWGIFARRFDEMGNPLGIPFQVNTTYVNDQNRPDVAVEPNGSFVVAWHGWVQALIGREVCGQKFSSNGDPVGSEFIANTHTMGSQSNPSIDMSTFGDYIVAWESGSGDPIQYGIFCQRYFADGSRAGGETRVSEPSDVPGSQLATVAYSTNGFIVAWQRSGVVYARHFKFAPVAVRQTTWGEIKALNEGKD